MAGSDNGACFLTLDVGTTAVKTGLFSSIGEMLLSSTSEYELLKPSENIVELPSETYWERCRDGIRDVVAKSPVPVNSIKSMGICSQGETLITLDRKGLPLRNAIVWMDNRSQNEAEEIRRHFGSESPTGQIDVFATWPITKILWLKKYEPEVYKKAFKYLLVEDYILYRLTGKYIGEYSLYTSSYMLDIVSKIWWNELLDFVGVEKNRLVELHESGEIIGTILPEVADDLGLDPGTRVVTGAMDQTAAMIGSGSIQPGMVTEITGAALAVCCSLGSYPDKKPGLMAVQYNAVPDSYLAIGWCPAGGMSLKWFRDTFFSAERDEAVRLGQDPYDILTAKAEKIHPGSNGLMFFPYMAGPGTLDVNPEARGSFQGIELHHTADHFIRAIMESIAFVMREKIEAIENMGILCTEIRSMGGGSKSGFWNRIKADVTGKPIRTMGCPEAGLLGVAILQATALGMYPDIKTAAEKMVAVSSVVHPDKQGVEAYEPIYRRYLEQNKRSFSL